jgi:cell division protein FtsN
LQVGSHRSPELTQREVGFLRKLGHKPFIKEWKDPQGRVWLRVMLGPYPSAAKAVQVGRELLRQKIIVSYKVLLRDQAWADTPAVVTAPPPAKAPERPRQGLAPAGPQKSGDQKPAPTSRQTEIPLARPAASLPNPGAAPKPECYLVVGSYPDWDQAQMIRQSWLLKGYTASLRAWQRGEKGIWHRVLLGPYAGREQALGVADQLKQSGLLDSYLLVETLASPLAQPSRP